MKKMYRASLLFDTIKQHEILKDTEKFVTYEAIKIDGSKRIEKEKKKQEYIYWGESWDDCINYMTKILQNKIDAIDQRRSLIQSNLDQIKQMKNPYE